MDSLVPPSTRVPHDASVFYNEDSYLNTLSPSNLRSKIHGSTLYDHSTLNTKHKNVSLCPDVPAVENGESSDYDFYLNNKSFLSQSKGNGVVALKNPLS